MDGCGGLHQPDTSRTFAALSSHLPRLQPVTIDPRLMLGADYWNRCAGLSLFVVSAADPVVRWRETNTETAPGLRDADGLTYDFGPYVEVYISQRARDGQWEAMYAHELGHALGYGHKGKDLRVTGGIMGSEELWNPVHDRALLPAAGYQVSPPPPPPPGPSDPPPFPILDRRAIREQARQARRQARDQRRAERRARRGR